jgi:predicted metalloprotease with PDZ domain
MNPTPRLAVAALVFFALSSVGFPANDQPVKLAPYTVEARPFGFLGIRHAAIGINPLKLIIGMNAVRFLQINELDPKSPGIAAGVKPGDRIVSIDGIPITKIGLNKLRHMGENVEVGQKIIVEVLRPSDGSKRVMEVVVTERAKVPNQAAQSTTPAVTPPARQEARQP